MSSILGSALSGMNAAVKQAEVAARNIANANSVGKVGENETNEVGESKAYEAVEAVQTSSADGTPSVKVRERNPATIIGYAPGNPLANAKGLIESPNVNLASEMINQNIAVNNYRASAKMFEVWNEMQKTTLDISS